MAPLRARRLAHLGTSVGVLVAVAGAGFVVRALVRESDAVGEALGNARAGWVVLSVPVALAAMTGIGLAWRRALELVGGGHPPLRPALRWYFLGQLGKYVPGGVWPVVGRSELARRDGVPRGPAYSSVALSLGATYLAAVLVVAALLPFDLAAQREGGAGAALLVLGLLPLGLAGLHPGVLGRLVAGAERVTRRRTGIDVPAWGDSVRLVARHVPSWLGIGAATWLVAVAFDPDAPLLNVVLAGVLSWVVGFVVVPVPGGIGVREAAFVAAAVGLTPGVAATVALVSRVVFIAVDAAGAALAVAVSGRSRASRAGPPCAAPGGS